MLDFSDHEVQILHDVWGKVTSDDVGHALARLLIVFPWTQRYFAAFGNLGNAAAIEGNPKVHAHGKVVKGGLDNAVKHLNNIKGAFEKLSKLHSEKLHVDSSNFLLLAETFTETLAAKFGCSGFSAETHEVVHKFLSAVVDALGRQYH